MPKLHMPNDVSMFVPARADDPRNQQSPDPVPVKKLKQSKPKMEPAAVGGMSQRVKDKHLRRQKLKELQRNAKSPARSRHSDDWRDQLE